MNEFIRRHRAEVIGALSGFDRLRIRGTLQLLSYVEGMLMYPGLVKVLLKDFKSVRLGLHRPDSASDGAVDRDALPSSHPEGPTSAGPQSAVG